ncbi:inhibitor of Bruton tyrosine kinase [Acipenser oxyrinchus oxyrinchus]|uniref:Inhibitor of Bruton tyrosine kinase n=1 Tax=Acipenser oxyrinchus oxyrinchus TaxID=40147 RepID=A0AAD8G9S3_ACIOX|nr:inhibitor of Bruton tyrosine kinase [Acipenser oxyrinchus oxyrinchus]
MFEYLLQLIYTDNCDLLTHGRRPKINQEENNKDCQDTLVSSLQNISFLEGLKGWMELKLKIGIINVNISIACWAVAGLRTLDVLSDEVLKELSAAYQRMIPGMQKRIITPYLDGPDLSCFEEGDGESLLWSKADADTEPACSPTSPPILDLRAFMEMEANLQNREATPKNISGATPLHGSPSPQVILGSSYGGGGGDSKTRSLIRQCYQKGFKDTEQHENEKKLPVWPANSTPSIGDHIPTSAQADGYNPWLKPAVNSPPAVAPVTFAAIVEEERQQKAALLRSREKPLALIQIEEGALLKIYSSTSMLLTTQMSSSKWREHPKDL